MKKILLAFFLFLIIFIIQKSTPINAASCIKSSGGINDMCVGYIRCPVDVNIYCCDNDADCQALQAPTQPQCASANPGAAACHLQSDTCAVYYGNPGELGCPQFQRCGANCSPVANPIPLPAGSTDVSKCDNGDAGIQTAIGCIHVLDTPEVFLGDILKWAVGIGGGIAFLLIIYAGFMIMTSAGNPERLKAGQELLTSAISGLILLVFSIFVLKFIGVDILGLGAFGFGN
jgi:Type IV secretion system pilin